MMSNWRSAILAWVLGVMIASGGSSAETAEQLLDRIGISRGICVLAGDPDGQLAIALARKSQLQIYVQLPTPDEASRIRRAAEAAGLDATRVHVERGDTAHLHLADNVADTVVVLDATTGPPVSEILRVLRPRGIAWLGNRRLMKPVPEGMGDWTHPFHGPDNNPVSQDRLIVAPYLTQFLSDPRYAPTPQVAVAAGGRVFKAFGHVAFHEREEPLLNKLVAFNGFNGTMLWQRDLPEGLMVHRNTVIATPDTLYLGDDTSCQLIDAATGQTKGQIRPPAELTGGTYWKWMALEGGRLYALIGEDEQKTIATKWKRQEHGWPWTGISRGYNQPVQPWGYGRTILAIDPKTKNVLWHHREEQPIDGRAVCMGGGRIFAFRFGSYLTCLDAQTGNVLWRKTEENSPELFDVLGAYLPRQGWQTNWRTVAYLKCSDQAVYFAGPQLGKLVAVSAEDGRLLWQHPYDNFQLVLHPKGLYAISGPWGNNVSRKFDPLTGEVLAQLSTGRRACTRPTATSDSILFRAMGGSVRFDLNSSSPRWVSPMRPPCQDGVTVANGLLYWWPYACDCQLSLYGVVALGSAGGFDFSPDYHAPQRLQTSDDPGAPSTPVRSSPNDWPTFRANNQRTATSTVAVPKSVAVRWQTKPSALPGTRPTAPVTAGGLVLLAGSDGTVRALEATTGREVWATATDGEIRIPPTIADGRALVGSGDGWVYALDAATGRLQWRFRAAPAERKIPVFGRLLSTWPAASGVLVQDDTAYVAAGLANYDGTYVYALDPETGRVRWCNDTSGHLDPEANSGVSAQGHLLLHERKLYLAGGNAVSPAVYDTNDGRCLNDPAPLVRCESTSPRGWELFLVGDRVIACGRPFYTHPDLPVYDHTVTQKMLHASNGPHDIVWLNNSRLLGYPPLDRDELSRCVTDEKIPRHVTQTWGRFRVSAKPRWQHDCPGSVAIAVASSAVVVADASRVAALDLATGDPLWTHELPASPVPWGLAVDRDGRVILTLVDGQVLCLDDSKAEAAS